MNYLLLICHFLNFLLLVQLIELVGVEGEGGKNGLSLKHGVEEEGG